MAGPSRLGPPLKDERFGRLSPRRRPHYSPTQRLRILQLKAARGWTFEQTAEALLVDRETLKSWLRQVDDQGEAALVRTSQPINRFPAHVRYLVRQLKLLCPSMGKVRIAQVLARAGLQLGPSTVRRILREREPRPEDLVQEVRAGKDGRLAKHPGELWHIDLTAVPAGAGYWVPWFPFTLPQRWPFCWWVLVVFDHVSREAVRLALFRSSPTSEQVQTEIATAMRGRKTRPHRLLTDKGGQFWCGSWKSFSRDRGAFPRYGAVGRVGSIALVERFIRTMKEECTSRILVPLGDKRMQRELSIYARRYNEHRPNQALGGRTPREACTGKRRSSRAGDATIQPRMLVVRSFQGRRHLPLVELREVA